MMYISEEWTNGCGDTLLVMLVDGINEWNYFDHNFMVWNNKKKSRVEKVIIPHQCNQQYHVHNPLLTQILKTTNLAAQALSLKQKDKITWRNIPTNIRASILVNKMQIIASRITMVWELSGKGTGSGVQFQQAFCCISLQI